MQSVRPIVVHVLHLNDRLDFEKNPILWVFAHTK